MNQAPFRSNRTLIPGTGRSESLQGVFSADRPQGACMGIKGRQRPVRRVGRVFLMKGNGAWPLWFCNVPRRNAGRQIRFFYSRASFSIAASSVSSCLAKQKRASWWFDSLAWGSR